MGFEADIEKLGIKSGDVLLMHSSFKSLGPVDGGIEAFVGSLLNVLGDGGTLLVPTLSYSHVTVNNPVFDVRRTASNVGAVTNYVRSLPGSFRSLSPTHSAAAVGKYARELTEGQLSDTTPLGAHSPFRRLPEYGGKILFLGCGTRCNTMIHSVEELTEPEYLFLDGDYPFTVIDENGTAHDITCKRHKFHTPDKEYVQRYDRVADMLDEKDINRGKIGAADSVAINAKAAWDMALSALRNDPLSLVDVIDKGANA